MIDRIRSLSDQSHCVTLVF